MRRATNFGNDNKKILMGQMSQPLTGGGGGGEGGGGIVVAASFTSLFVVCEFAEAVILNHFTLKLASL